MTLEGLVNEIGPLVKTFPKLDPSTIQHAAEITNDRRDDEKIKRPWFWTADSNLYTIEDNDVVLYLDEREYNLIFKNIEEATNQLINNKNYIPKKEDIETVISSKSTLRTKLSDLKLEKYNDEFSYFEFDTVKYDKTLNQAQRTFVERAYGQGDDFKKNMKMFKDAGISTIRIYVLYPKYVKNHVKEGSAIVRACRLGGFGGGSLFVATGRDVDLPGGTLRGVPKPVAKSSGYSV